MTNNNDTAALSLPANDAGYDPIEDRLRESIRATTEAVFEEELNAFPGRCRAIHCPAVHPQDARDGAADEEG